MKYFLVFPFSQYINGQQINDEVKSLLESVRNTIISNNCEVFLAHYREKWGQELMSSSVCTPLDFEEMRNADCVLAFPGAPISGGVHIELGWASAMNKRICLFLQSGVDYSPLVCGLSMITQTNIVFFSSMEELKQRICEQVFQDSTISTDIYVD